MSARRAAEDPASRFDATVVSHVRRAPQLGDSAPIGDEPVSMRDNSGKPRLSQLHHFALDHLAAHCDQGRRKYPDRDRGDGTMVPNWTIGGKPDEEYLDAIDRHLGEFVRGEIYDHELGTYVMAAIAWNALAWLTLNSDGPSIDPYFDHEAFVEMCAELQRKRAAQ
jgi:hypothetical protein